MSQGKKRELVENLGIGEKFKIKEVYKSNKWDNNIGNYDTDKTTGKFTKRSEHHESHNDLPKQLRKILKEYYHKKRNNTRYLVRLEKEKKYDPPEYFEIVFNNKSDKPPLILYTDYTNSGTGAYVKEIEV